MIRASLFLNLVLAIALIWSIINLDISKKKPIYYEMQYKLVELEGLIAFEEENNWSTPHLVTNKLSNIVDLLYLGIDANRKWNLTSDEDVTALEQLYSKLSQYPVDELYKHAVLTEKDMQHFVELRAMLREAGIGLRISIEYDWSLFIQKVQILNENIPSPL
jgi:CO dehydrogenase/acetyl-CoA synthase gamma subunit (corrinoid Fe-S protein)